MESSTLCGIMPVRFETSGNIFFINEPIKNDKVDENALMENDRWFRK